MRAVGIRLAALALLGALATAPGAAVAQDPAPAAPDPAELASESPPSPDAPEEEQRAYWEARARAARNRVEAAREVLAAAEAAYQDARQRKKRGDPLAQAVSGRDAAQAELEAALRYQDEELPEEARRAGALPGWLRLD